MGTLIYRPVAGSPFTLTPAWQRVAAVDVAARGLRISPVGGATAFDIEWTSVAAGASAPTDAYGEAILGGEDFPGGIPIGDIYLRSASGQVAIVKTGS